MLGRWRPACRSRDSHPRSRPTAACSSTAACWTTFRWGVMTAAGEGPVLAVDVMGRTRLGQPGTRPTLVETLARATVLGSWQRLAATAEQAQRVITPDVQAIGLRDFRRLDEAVAAGRRAVETAVEAGLLLS